MKALGVVQLQQKKFKLLGIEGPWRETLGDLPAHFMAIIYGNSGNGKTEFCLQLAKYLTAFGKVAWLSYEQGHGYDLQKAVIRNQMPEGKFVIVDPLETKKKNVGVFEALDAFIGRRNSAPFIFIDSLDYTNISREQYFSLKEKYGKKKAIIWISHAQGKKPATLVGEKIQYDGGIGIFIKQFIAFVNKNRFGGFADYVIYEERARELNPLYFEQKAIKNGKMPNGNIP